MSLIVFAFCLLAGLTAGNTLETTLLRALEGLAATLMIGLLVGAMARKMLDENVKGLNPAANPQEALKAPTEKILPAKEAKIAPGGR